MRRLIVTGLMLLCGCSQQEEAQRRMIGRMQIGLAEVRQAQDQRQQAMQELYAGRRRVLDAAFDQDVKQAAALDAAWVIDHRKAYSAALEAMCRQEQASTEAHARMRQNLQVIDEGLQRLGWMSELRENWGKALEKEVDNAKN